MPFSFPRLYLAAGATTIRTAGSIEPYSDIRIKKDIDLGLLPGPFIELTAPYIEGKNAIFPQMKENKTPEEAAAFVNYRADQGFTSFKAYTGVDKPMLKAAIDAAHKRKLKITAHLCAVAAGWQPNQKTVIADHETRPRIPTAETPSLLKILKKLTDQDFSSQRTSRN